MLFPKADIDSLVQVYDKFRIDATKSFSTTDDELTEFNIYPDFVNQPLVVYDVLSESDPECWFLDWAYETDGDFTVRVEMKTALLTKTVDYVITAITEEDDNLFSDDAMLYSYESELKKYLPEGRNSWKYLHRKAQEEILDYLYRNDKRNPDGSKITKDQIIEDKLELWSTFETMLLIYQDIKTSNSEAFTEKLDDYDEKRGEARERYIIVYDSDSDGDVDDDDIPTGTNPKFFSR